MDFADEVRAANEGYCAARGIGIRAPGLYTMPADEYHADPCPSPSLSSSIGRTIIAASPLHAWTAHPRLNPAYVAEEKEAFDLGSAAHALLLEGADRMCVIDADSYRTKDAKEARDAARARGAHPVLATKYRDVQAMAQRAHEAIARCPDLSGLTLADGKAEQVAIWQEGDAWMRARFDWIANDRRVILDYKTTAASASPELWPRTMAGMGGEFQGAFYHLANERTGGPEGAKFVFIVQETTPPYACALQGLSPAYLDLGYSKVREAIATWQRCMKSAIWPAYEPRICWMEPPAWETARWEEHQAMAGNPYDIEKFWKENRA